MIYEVEIRIPKIVTVVARDVVRAEALALGAVGDDTAWVHCVWPINGDEEMVIP